jgi:trans-aconitate 2-methyltransferase
MTWDPDLYQRFGEERALPFHHLVAAIVDLDPLLIVDLGCGSGSLTTTLLVHWPGSSIIGVDSSPEMIDRARQLAEPGRLVFELGDAGSWTAPQPVDLMLSNACFHWLDDHVSLLDHLLPQLAEPGVLAFQVPANHLAPSHTILREMCSSPPWRDRLEGLPAGGTREPEWYVAELGSRGLQASVWQTTYLHQLGGENPVLEWVRGTTLRPVLERLTGDERAVFEDEYGRRLGMAYPARAGTTVFPFTRTFVVARRA